ncbi:MAG: hypothetical protein JO197_21690 [Acidobacteria bacterium]|nr:hypothetical protein [Acidobacteriota bacterium]MBV9474748.1 hypothetical protein [Acidobacteriota bacterium]
MTKPRFLVVVRSFFLAALAVVSASAVRAQDVVTVGTVSASGSTVDVPVYIRDVSGTPLGMDRPAGSKIQSYSIKVTYAPTSAISSISFSRAGITANLTPTSEFTPATSNSVSLLDTFQESTNPIPFTLNAAAPGNQVAHLVVTLSASATPGSTITLTLDSSLTQLTDAGGSAATKETVGNGQLHLVNGAINVSFPTVSLTPSNQNILTGSSGGMITLKLSAALTSSTTVTLTSSNPSAATVPATVNIPAGVKSVSFTASPVAPGTTTITATLPQSAGGASDTATVRVQEPTSNCATPAAPQPAGPATSVDSGAAYTLSWLPIDQATEYVIDESTDADFTSVTTTTTAEALASFMHAVTTDTRYYYRVRARNRAGTCDLTSAASPVVSVFINAPAITPSAKRILAVIGSTPGNFGSFFRTGVQIHNPHASAISGRIVYHPAGASGSDNDPFLAYALEPGQTLQWDDLLPAMGGLSGLGTGEIVSDAGSLLPISAVRVFNDAGANGTTGLTEPQLRPEDALQTGETATLIAPPDFTHFRLNIGVRTLEQGVDMAIVVRDKNGVVVQTTTQSYDPTFFTQPGSAMFLDYTLTGGESIAITVTRGSAFVYGATTDNTTNDPSMQFVQKAE